MFCFRISLDAPLSVEGLANLIRSSDSLGTISASDDLGGILMSQRNLREFMTKL